MKTYASNGGTWTTALTESKNTTGALLEAAETHCDAGRAWPW